MQRTESAALRVQALGKSFGDVQAVADVSFEVRAGQVVGLLGPNGAGKTTTVKMLTTLIPIDSGSASVAGFDVAGQPAVVRQLIGVAGQGAAVDEKLTARENLSLFARLYKLPGSLRRQRVADLIDRFDMESFADRPAHTYSGGQRRRLDVAAALVAEPPVLLLDEPTTGLDPRSRADLWAAIRELAEQGTAIVLTTQYLEEADQLADYILILDGGRVVAEGTPSALKRDLDRDVLQVQLTEPGAILRATSILGQHGQQVISDPTDSQTLQVAVGDDATLALKMLRELQDNSIALSDFQLRRPTLDDVFLALTASKDRVSKEA
ncbi:MAG: ATP-binding cassette domain-containing protein [Actinobacteria bacterium]|nr:ATP-binding cassette domain-containing protein [Actinomycetota bacterium]MCB9411519.1 ATP-binding cassette domain-containing protein [Actinomycetota bacterium]